MAASKKLALLILIFLLSGCTDSDPYSVEPHWDYIIFCESGFVYKKSNRHGTILILNSDATPYILWNTKVNYTDI